MANLLDELHLRPDLEAYDEAEKRRSPNVTDYLRAVATGYVGDTARGLGELLQKSGVDYGARMRESGDWLEKQQTEEMSPGGRRAFTQPVFTDDKDSLLGFTPNPEGAWGPAFMQTARSVPQMAMMAAPAAPVAGALRAVPPIARAIKAGGFTGKAANVLTTGVPLGAAEGAQGALVNAAQTRSQIEGMKHEDLLKSTEYKDLFDATDPSLSETERSKIAKDEVAARAAKDVFNKTLPWTGAFGVLTGGGAPGMVMRGGFRKGAFDIAKRAGVGAAEEAAQEIPQSGGEQYIQNVATKEHADPTQDPWEGVVSQALGGGAVGGLTGAAMGGGHALLAHAPASPVDRLVEIAKSLRPGSAAPTSRASPASAAPTTAGAVPAQRVDTAAAAKTIQAAQAAAMAPTPDDPVAALQALPEEQRQEVSKDWPKMEPGAPTQFQVPGSPTPISGRFALAEADSLVASHSPSLKENPDYPKALQPRDRTAAGYELQVAQMSQNLQPAMLGASPSATDGAPIVGPDGVIESGNGRWIALQRAYSEEKGARAQAYREWLGANAPSFGLKPEQIQAMKKPVLVRERMTPLNRAEFARAANAPTTAQMGPLDQAKADAQRMGDLSGLAVGEEGNLFVPQNQKVVRGFFSRLPITEQTGLVDKEGRISQTGQRRFLNAVILRAYGEHSPAVMRLVESVNPDLRGLLGGLTKIAPMVAKARDAITAKNLADRDLTGLIVGAVDELIRLKSEGKSVADELAQAQMFTHLPEGTMEVLAFLDANSRNPAKISQFVLNYLGELARYGQPGQNDMFGAPAVPGAPDLVRRAQEMTREQAPAAVQPGTQPGAATPAGAAEVGGGQGAEAAVVDAGATPGAAETGKPAGGEPSAAEVEAKAAAVKAEIEGRATALPPLAKVEPGELERLQTDEGEQIRKRRAEKEAKAAPGAEKPAETAQKAPESENVTDVAEVAQHETQHATEASKGTEKGSLTDKTGSEPASLPIDEAAHAAATSPKNALPEPTQDQKGAGNYQLGHLTISGLDISIENPEGSIRKSKPGAVVKWETKMQAHYGYVKGVPARAPDKEHVDVFVKPGTSENFTGEVFVVDQNKEDGSFDEPKVMIGWPDEAAAREAYLANYQKGWESRIRGITGIAIEQFKTELQDANAFLTPQVAEAKPADTRPPAPFNNDDIGKEARGKPGAGWGEKTLGKIWYTEWRKDVPGVPGHWVTKISGGPTVRSSEIELVNPPAKRPVTPQVEALPGMAPLGAKGETNAGEVRGDQGQVQKPGSERPSSEAGGGKDLQLPEKTGPAPSDEKGAEAPPVTAYRQLANWVVDRLGSLQKFSNEELTTQAAEAFGGTAAAGRFSPRDAYDAMELGVNLYIEAQKISPAVGAKTALTKLDDLRGILNQLPTQAKRTNEQIEYQQFSTPPTLAYLAAWVANPRAGETVLEPSAGTGDLAIFAKMAGAKVVANEITPRRADILKELGFEVTREDAEQLNNILPATIKPTLVLMNPPFSSAGGRIEGQRNIENGIRHLDQAWERLEPGGRMVALMGENFGGPAASRRWLAGVRQAGEVRALVTISGKEYAKYGTTYGTSLMVLDKTGKPQEGTTVTGDFQTVAEALRAIEGVRNERSEPTAPASVPEGERLPVEQVGGEALPDVRGEAVGTGAARPESGAAPARPAAPAETQAKGPAPGEEGPGQVSLPLEPGKSGQSERGSGEPGTIGREPEAAGLRGQAAVEPGGPDTTSGGQPAGVTLEKQEKKAQAKLTGEVFEAYTPSKVKIPGAKPHISELVESAAMSSVEPPDATYTPNLPDSVVKGGKLSDSQLEAVVYAGQAHQSFLPNGDRRGFFIGDGTGVGKGREISGILLDNLRQGRKKAVWVSEKQGLIEDAKRDYGDTGGHVTEIFAQAKVKASDPIERQSGILFTTYSTLRSAEKREANEADKRIAKTRVKQLTDWLGPDFDGVIIFDESHNMQSSLKQKAKRGVKDASLQALAGLELQRMMPKARVVYSSATGATKVANLGYAQRLGLWGEQTAFADAPTFVSAIDSAGVSAMELVARDLKQMGMYVARSLSFKGVTYERVTHELSAVQRAMYDRMAEGWQVTLKSINEAMAVTGAENNGQAKGAAYSKYWGAQQRFFNQVITSMQMPTVIEKIEEDLKRGDAVVVQLVNTMEAEFERKLALVEEDADLQDLDMTPRDALIQMVQKAFPVQEFHIVTKDGNEVSVPVLDSEGNPVLSKQAIAMRDALIKDLEDIKVPDAPLDMLLKKFGPDMVAEVTGRSSRMVPAKDESGETKIILEKRTASAARADADAFMDDKKRILVFSGVGGTGYSFHSDRTKENQRKRQHYGVQLGWRADQAVQGFGRSHRSNEANQPNYKLAETNLKAQKRFISSVARRLDQMGALTKGQRQASGQQLFDEKDNLEGVYAGRAIRQLIYDSYHGNEPRVPFAEMIEGQMGLNLRNPETGVLADARLPDVPQFLNRLLSLKIAAQDAVFDAFFERMESLIETAKQRNELDVGVQSLGALEVVKQDEQTVYTDQRTGAETKIVRLKATYPREFTKWKEASERIAYMEARKKSDLGVEGYWISTGKTEGRPFIIYRYGTKTLDNGAVEISYRSLTPLGVHYDANPAPENAKKSTKAQVEKLWDEYIDKQGATFDRTEHVLTGTILPVWDRMHGQFVRVVQTQTKDGERLIGRWIAPSSVEATLKAFGMSEVAKMTPAQLRAVIMDDNMAVVLANGWTMMRTKKAGEMRLEIVSNSGYGNASVAELERYGAFTEVDGWKQRTYLPVDQPEALERLLKVRPAADIIERPKSSRAEQEGPGYELEQKRKPPVKFAPGEIRDLFAIDPVGTSGAGVIETLVVTPVQKGTLHIGFDKIDTPQKAAHAFANLRKHPREYFNILMLDENDKPIAAAELFSGTVTQTAVYPREVVALAYQTPGARKIWFAHVHPSGVPQPSHADEILTRGLASMFGKDIGIELMGHIIIAGTKANSFWHESVGYAAEVFDIPPASRKFSIPLMERMIRKNTGGARDALSSPRAVRDFIRKLSPGQDGLLWLDAQHRVQGWQPMTMEQMGNMKTGDIRTGAAELFRRIGRNNPAAAIAVVHADADMPISGTPTIDKVATALRGLKSMLSLMDVQVLDGFITDGVRTVSLAERGVMQDTPKYSVAPRFGRGMTARQVQESLDRIAEQWNNAPTMRAVGSEEELPDVVRTKASAEGAKGRIQAVFDPVSGVMHVVARAVGSVEELQFVVMHEVMGHYGLRGAFGQDLDAALQYLWTNNPRVRAKTAEASQRWGYTMEDRRLDAIEEAVAELAAEGFKFNGIRQFFAAVQSWLRLHGMGELADWLEGLTDAELTSVLTMSRAYVVDGGMHFSGQGDPALSAAGPTWYSALRRHIDAMNVNQAGKEHWQRELEAAIKSGKVKKDEVEWSGLPEWLDAQTGKVAKGDVVEFIGQNGVQVTETVLGGTGKVDATSTIDQLVVELDALGYTVRFAPEDDVFGVEIETIQRRSDRQLFFPFGERIPGEADMPFSMLPDNVRPAAEHLIVAVQVGNGPAEGETRHSSWQLPGGKNYRELLLTLLEKTRATDIGTQVNYDDRGALLAGNFRSSHFDQPNILAHIRFNERTDAQGKRVLFIEEIQSDWAQKGKREGFREAPPLGTLDNLTAQLRRELDENGRTDLARQIEGQIREAQGKWLAVPPAPFVGKTESWVALALKRMIRYAAENGFERVAWTTGEQQAGRYSLEKHIKSLEWGHTSDGQYSVVAVSPDGRPFFKSAMTLTELRDAVGVEVAQKIVDGVGALKSPEAGFTKSGKIAGLDLKVGGQGMRSFYDKIVPNVANDVLKKLGGGRVGTFEIPATPEWPGVATSIPMFGKPKVPPHEQSGFDITPTMRESVMRGLPLFAVMQGDDRPITPGGRDFSATVPGVTTTFMSGMSRARDFLTAGYYERPVGVDIGELSNPAITQLARSIVHHKARVFVDSGAFGVFRRQGRAQAATAQPDMFNVGGRQVRPLDFDAIMKRYDDILDAIERENPAEETINRLYLVMPDVVGDQAESLRLVQEHAPAIKAFAWSSLTEPIVPLQRGPLSLVQLYDKVVNALGTKDFVVGIPSNVEAAANDQVTELVRERRPARIHILGAVSPARLGPRMEAIREGGGQVEVTADANSVRSAMVGIGRDEATRKAMGLEPEAPVRASARINLPEDIYPYEDTSGLKFSVDPAVSDQERANAILAQQTNQIRPLESLFKGATELTRLPKLTGFLYDKLVSAVQNALPESAKAGLIDKYGVPEYVQDRFAETIGRERQQLRETGNLLDRMPVTREEARVAYQWLNQNAEGGDQLLADVSPEAKEVLNGWKEWAHQMQGEAIRLGQLDADTAARNEYAYTHRSYLKYEQGKDKKSGAGSIRILGDQYRTRGLTDEINTEDLAKWNPQWWERKRGKEDIGLKGEMFLKLEKRVGSKEGMAVLPGVEETAEPGKVTRRVYWPADQAVPPRFADYDLEGTWEARWVDGKTVTLWRDFTPEERKAMGEIDDARYAIAKTSQLMIHDIEVGKLLEWLANHEARPAAPRDAEVVQANESLRQAYRPGTWVKVPESNAPGTKVAKYGKLAGLYIPGPIWNEIRQVVNQRYKPLGETYDQLLRLWKISKTALSPAVHMNNIFANVMMAEWQDLTAAHMAKAMRVMFVKDPAHKIILDKFEDAGGSVGMWTLSEIQKSQMEPLLAQLERDAAVDNPDALVNAAAVIQALQAGRYRQAADMVEELGPVRGSKAVLDKMIEIYQGEDQLFRLAAFLKAKEEGATDTAAGKFARESFLDYHISAPWINIMRSTAFPFVAFTYRALPLLAETMAKKPWKMLKFAAIAGALDALGYALSGGDEDRERKLLPEEKSGVIWGYSGKVPFTQMEVNLGVTPKLVRMPWNDQFGSPVFLDIRRFVPLGDIVDVGQVHSAIPLLPTMMPGGPLSLIAELVANRSFFTGKEIVKDTDTDLERTKKLASYVYQWAIPNIPLVPGSYSFLSIKGASAGETDVFGRERSIAQAAGSALGVRLASYPEDLGRQQVIRQLAAEKRELGENVSALRRQFQRGGLDREEFEAKIKEQLEKRIQFETQARRRLSAG